MAYATIFEFNDGGTTVKYERDDTESGGPGTTGRHRITEDGVVFTAAPAGRPARSPNYMAGSTAVLQNQIGWGSPRNNPAIYRVTEVTP